MGIVVEYGGHRLVLNNFVTPTDSSMVGQFFNFFSKNYKSSIGDFCDFLFLWVYGT